MSEPQSPRAPRLDLLSPLPPVRSGIADYALDLLPALHLLCDVRVVRVPGQPVAEKVVERWAPVDAARLGEDGRLPLYQMGNNDYHEAIWELAWAHSGLLTLHDLFLHHLLLERTLARGDLDGYVSSLVRDHGWQGGAIALPPRWSAYGQAGLFSLPAHRGLLERQRGILVHSRWAAEMLRDEGIGRPVATVTMPIPVPPAAALGSEGARRFRGQYGVPDGVFTLGSFGFQTPIKRTSSVIRALAEPGLERVHLLIGGQVAPQLDYGVLARDLGVQGRVHVTGYLPAEDLLPAIAACDVVANLRYPTAGETSASLLRVLACGRGALVSDYAQFSELPDDVAIKIPLVGDPGTSDGVLEGHDPTEVAAISSAVRQLLSSPERLRSLGEESRRWVLQHHRPEASAAQIIEAASAWADLPMPQVPRHPVEARRPSSLTWGQLENTIRVRGIERWCGGERRLVEVELRNRGFARLLPAEHGPGGVAVQVKLIGDRGELLEAGPWLPLQRVLEPGEAETFRLRLRRPLGACRLRVEPHVLGAGTLESRGGSAWESAV